MNPLVWIHRLYKRYAGTFSTRGPVRYMFPAILGTIVLLGANAVSSSQSYVYLIADGRTVEVGELMTVEVGVSAHTPINAIDITVEFPQDKLEIFSVDRGQSVLTIWTEDPIVEDDSVQLIGGTFKRGFIGDHEIVSIKFRAKSTGQYEVTVGDTTFVAGDGSGDIVPASEHQSGVLSLFNFDENTSAEEIEIAIASGMTTDINQDGKVTLQDISAFMGVWSNKSQVLDFNNDGRMTFKDFSIILADFFLQ